MKLEPINPIDVARSIAARIKRAITTAPGDRWNKSGRLLSSVRAVANKDGSAAVIVASDRLERTEVAEKFAAEIIPADLDASTRELIAQAVHDAIKTEDIRGK